MGRGECNLTTKLTEQLQIDHLSMEMKDHLKNCKDCSEAYRVHKWMKNYSDSAAQKVPSFNSLWPRAFRDKKIAPELIEKAMRPMKIAGILGRGAAIIFIAIFTILNKTEIFQVGKQLNSIGQAGKSFFSPIIRMFNSSVFVSVPLTIIFASILIYFLFSIINSVNKRTFGST